MFIKTPSIYSVYIKEEGEQRAQWLNLANITRAEVLECKDGTQAIKLYWLDGNAKYYEGNAAQQIMEELKHTEGSYRRQIENPRPDFLSISEAIEEIEF